MNVEILVNFSSDLILEMISVLTYYNEHGKFPIISESVVIELLDLVIFFEVDDLFTYFIPTVSSNLDKIKIDTVRKIPFRFRKMVIENIPVCKFDPDFVLQHFDIHQVVDRFKIERNIILTNNFMTQYFPISANEIEDLANNLFDIDKRFGKFEFVKSYCTKADFKYDVVPLSDFKNLKRLTIIEATINDTLFFYLTPTMIKVEFVETKLSNLHVKEIISFLPDSSIEFLSIRNCKIGVIGGEIIAEYIIQNPITKLKILDLSFNNVGAEVVKKLFRYIPGSSVTSLAVDGNIATTHPENLITIHLVAHHLERLSIRGLYWDEHSAFMAKDFLSDTSIKWFDISAQTVHMNNDNDLTGTMLQDILESCSGSVEFLNFSNHRIDKIDLSFLLKLAVKRLYICNANLHERYISPLVELVANLEHLDLYSNRMGIREQLLRACALSETLTYLNLSENTINDTHGYLFFILLSARKSNIDTLLLSSCHLSKKSFHGLITLLSSGIMSFKKLDICFNNFFKSMIFTNFSDNTTKIDKLLISGNGSKIEPIRLLLMHTKDVKYIGLDSLKINIVKEISSLIRNVHTISLNYCKIPNPEVLLEIVKITRCHVLWLINSMNVKTFKHFTYMWSDMPLLSKINVGADLKEVNSKIPISIQTR